jgi:phospholipase A1
MPKVIVFLPGILGSALSLNGQQVWPGSFTEYLTGYSQQRLTELLDPGVVAVDIIRSFAIVPQYQALMDFLSTCGFSETSAPPTLYTCPYDWRKSNQLSAQTLDAKIQRVNQDYNGQAEITLITHSMGGLVARYYLESGKFNGSPGYGLIKNLFTLAGPHLGAPIAVIKALGQDKTVFLSGVQIKALSSNTAYPSLYEMFPHRGEPIVWDTGSTPIFQPIDLYASGIGQSAGLVEANLQEADAFHKSLKPLGSMLNIRYFFFVGTQKTTAVNLTSTRGANTLNIQESDRDDAGDGTVPIWSSREGTIAREFVGGEHSVIYKDSQLQQTLHRLLAPQNLAAFAALVRPQIVVSVQELVVRPNEETQIDITLSQRTTKLSGKLSVERALLSLNGDVLQGYEPVDSPQNILYEGPSFDRLRIQFTAPATPAIYRVTFTLSGPAHQSGSDQFFVQAGPAD